MNRVYWTLPILLILAIGIGWTISSQGNPGNITPTNENDTPLINQSAGNPIYYYFYTDTCGYCRIMERDTHGNSSVIEALEANFTFIKVNTGKERQLAQKYNIYAVPASVFTYPDGQEIGRVMGLVDPESFLNVLDQVLDIYPQNG